MPFDEPLLQLERIISNIEKVMVGKRRPVELVLTSLLCGGHVLLEDVPGVGKTMLVKALAKTVDAGFKRIQFTPDLLPSDVTGVSVYNRGLNEFQFRPGPLFTNLVLADELNRTSPKTQAALLEAMEERHVTVDGETYPLPQPFLILATQNPLEHAGTYQLPEAQLDRFFMRIRLGYPDRDHEVEMLGRMQEQSPLEQLKPVLFREELIRLQRQVRHVHVDESLREYMVELAVGTRKHKDVLLGASPRAVLALMLAGQAQAYRKGRSYVVPDDLKEVLEPVLAHRLLLTPEARMAGRSAEQVLASVAQAVPVPGLRYAPGS
ncbi:AAA family ATPase [Gorillibacterium sp. sgz5001074]|uniref:AAA family ATPase n=1 Tax=Gorillibacterium sp. sgz5001074 TaxID=3446695 RepID=UPI003F665AC4